jgi:hypothetical protein
LLRLLRLLRVGGLLVAGLGVRVGRLPVRAGLLGLLRGLLLRLLRARLRGLLRVLRGLWGIALRILLSPGLLVSWPHGWKH